MEAAFELAEEALAAYEVPVGCAFVYNGEIVACGRNETNASGDATQHAEIVAINRLERWCSVKGLSLTSVLPETYVYVTVEPCIMCTAALRFSLPGQPKCIIYSSPNARFGGCGSVMNIHNDDSSWPPLNCQHEDHSERSVLLLKCFFDNENLNAPDDKRIRKVRQDKS